MIDVKQAVRAAADQFDLVFKEANYQKVRLEEVDLSENNAFWLITFSFETAPTPGSIAADLYGPDRQYKTVKLDAETGEVKSIKIRVLA